MMTKAKPLPELELINKILSYDPITGLFTWKRTMGGRALLGALAGSYSKSRNTSYLNITVEKRVLRAHRLAWYIMTKTDPLDMQVDHIDGDGLNNRFANLRLATAGQNQRNRPAQKNNKSGYKGVYWATEKRKWRAEIRVNRRKIALGYFHTPELAHMAYCKAAAELHGEFARGA